VKILILGLSKQDLDKWRNDNFLQGDIYKSTNGVLIRGNDEFYFLTCRRNDDRVRGMEFQKIVILEGAIDFGGQYSMRVRP
jgi:hypothetical protein